MPQSSHPGWAETPEVSLLSNNADLQFTVPFATSYLALDSKASFSIKIKFTQEAVSKANSSQTFLDETQSPDR